MRIILQRISRADVVINGGERREIGMGLLLLLGICRGDDERTCDFMAEKAVRLRIFPDKGGAMNLSLLDVKGEAMLISNFTLYANCRKGRRPSFVDAASPDYAAPLYLRFVDALKRAGVEAVVTGEFGAHMDVSLTNDGPVTVILDSAEVMP